MVVKKIPRDHKGLYLSVPFTHGKQSNISEDTHNEVKRTKHAKASCKVFHDTYKPDIRSNLMSGKIEGRKQK